MIHTPTVLVLGAGASKPYGYPLGGELVDHIVALTGTNSSLERLFGAKFDVATFHHRLSRSDPSSIDAFLESNPEFAEFGKLAIAAALTVFRPTPIGPFGSDDHWYKYIWRQLHEGAATVDQFRTNTLRVITYNYDRSFERYITGVVKHNYPTLTLATDGFVRGLLTEIVPVIHLHGDLGDADDSADDKADRSQFATASFIKDAAAGIQIIHENSASEGYTRAHKWLDEADRVYLLGFGYHPTNCERLNVRGHHRQYTPRGQGDTAGTSHGLGKEETLRAARAAGIPTQHLHNETCLPFLRNHARLD